LSTTNYLFIYLFIIITIIIIDTTYIKYTHINW